MVNSTALFNIIWKQILAAIATFFTTHLLRIYDDKKKIMLSVCIILELLFFIFA